MSAPAKETAEEIEKKGAKKAAKKKAAKKKTASKKAVAKKAVAKKTAKKKATTKVDAQAKNGGERPQGRDKGNPGSRPAAEYRMDAYTRRSLNGGDLHWKPREPDQAGFRLNYPVTDIAVRLNTTTAQRIWARAFSPFCAAFLGALNQCDKINRPDALGLIEQYLNRWFASFREDAENERQRMEQLIAHEEGEDMQVMRNSYGQPVVIEARIKHPQVNNMRKAIKSVDRLFETVDLAHNLGLVEQGTKRGIFRDWRARVNRLTQQINLLGKEMRLKSGDPLIDLTELRQKWLQEGSVRVSGPKEAPKAESPSAPGSPEESPAKPWDPWAE